MTDQDRLRTQMALLGAKFLERTRGEVGAVCELAERVARGDSSAYEQLAYLVHRISGGGATFGFQTVSECAGEIERLIDPAVRQGETLPTSILERVRACSLELKAQIDKIDAGS